MPTTTWQGAEKELQLGNAKIELEKLGHNVDGVYLVFDELETDIVLGGEHRAAVFYLDDKGRARTAVLCGDGTVVVRCGW